MQYLPESRVLPFGKKDHDGTRFCAEGKQNCGSCVQAAGSSLSGELHHVEGFEPCTGERSSVRCLSCRQDNFWEMGVTGSQKHIARNLQQPQP